MDLVCRLFLFLWMEVFFFLMIDLMKVYIQRGEDTQQDTEETPSDVGAEWSNASTSEGTAMVPGES